MPDACLMPAVVSAMLRYATLRAILLLLLARYLYACSLHCRYIYTSYLSPAPPRCYMPPMRYAACHAAMPLLRFVAAAAICVRRRMRHARRARGAERALSARFFAVLASAIVSASARYVDTPFYARLRSHVRYLPRAAACLLYYAVYSLIDDDKITRYKSISDFMSPTAADVMSQDVARCRLFDCPRVEALPPAADERLFDASCYAARGDAL